MQFGLLSSTLLCVIAWMNFIQAVHGHVHDCKCVRKTDTQIQKAKLVSYTIQEESICNVRVVIFTTVKGKILCSDPNSSWTKEGMRTLDAKKAMMAAQRKEAENNKTPAASTMNPTPQTVSTSISSVSTSIPPVSTSIPSVSTSIPPVSTSTPSVSTVAPTEATTAAVASTSEASTLKPIAAPLSDQTSSTCQKKQKEQNRGSRNQRKSRRQGRNRRKSKGRMKEWQKKNKARKQLQVIFRCKQMLPN